MDIIALIVRDEAGYCQDYLWARDVRANLLPNHNNLAMPYKDSSLVCPLTGHSVTGVADIGKRDPSKPWEIPVVQLRYENPGTPAPVLPPNPARMLLHCHQMQYVKQRLGFSDNETKASVPTLSRTGTHNDERPLPQGNLPRTQTPVLVSDLLPQLPIISQHTPKCFTVGLPDTNIALATYFLEPPSCADDIPPGTHPVYLLLANNNFDGSPPAHICVEILRAGPQEQEHWKKRLSLKEIRAEHKAQARNAVQQRLAALPKEAIWQAFHIPDPQSGIIQGYRPTEDPKTWWFAGKGSPAAKVWILGLYPSHEEIRAKTVFAGPGGEELSKALLAAGLTEHDVYIDNIVKTFHPPKTHLKTEVKQENRWLLARQLHHFQPERVICLGADVFNELAPHASFKKDRAIYLQTTYPQNAEEPGISWTGRVAATFHPAGCLRPEGRKNLPLLRADLDALLKDLVPVEPTPTIEQICTPQDLQQWETTQLAWLNSLPPEHYAFYAIDTEGYGLPPQQDKFVSIQMCPILATPSSTRQSFETPGQWKPVPKENLMPKEIPAHLAQATLFVFIEHAEPQILSATAFTLFEEPQLPQAPASKPVVVVANNEEERVRHIQNHTKNTDLVIFCPYKAKHHLENHKDRVGQTLKAVLHHPKVAGVVLTNANYDRVRLETTFGEDLLERPQALYPAPLDTMLAEHVCDQSADLSLKASLNAHLGWPRQDRDLESYTTKYQLNAVANRYHIAAGAWALYPWSILKPYAAKDVYGCALLFIKQMQSIAAQELTYQQEQLQNQEPNTLGQAFAIQCAATDATYDIHRQGMPVGEHGLHILYELTDFYSRHEKQLVQEYKDTVYRLTGFKDADPNSHEELAFLLFAPSSPLSKRGIQPWKEAGAKGRLWEDIPPEERATAKPSTDTESLEILAANTPDPEIGAFLLRLSEIITIRTLRRNFLPDLHYGIKKAKGIIGILNLQTLALHTTYTPTLDTARCRSIPNLATFPKGETKRVAKILGEPPPYTLREIICAPEGAVLLNRDWKTAEVLALGYLSQDPNMLAIIGQMNQGMDFHVKLAIQTYPYIRQAIQLFSTNPTPPRDWLNATIAPAQQNAFIRTWEQFHAQRPKTALTEPETHKLVAALFPQERSNIKPVTFGVPYGRSAAAIAAQLNRQYYVNDTRSPDGQLLNVSVEQAQTMVDSYKIKEFHTAWNYLESQATHALTRGFLACPWGYLRHFPKGTNPNEIKRKSYNYQIQHLVAVNMNLALADWTRRKRELNLKSYAYNTLYDNIGWVVFEDELQTVWDISQEVMTTHRPVGPAEGPFAHLAQCRFPTEGYFSKTWEGKPIPLDSLNIKQNPEKNNTGIEFH